LSGNPAPRRQKGKSVTASIKSSSPNGDETIGTLMARDYKGIGNQDLEDGRGLVLNPIALAENTIGRQPQNGGNGDGFTDGGPMYTLNATGVHGVVQPIPFKETADCLTAAYGTKWNGNASADNGSLFVNQPVYEMHGKDSRVRELGDICTTMTAAYGTGGGNVPVTIQPIAYNIAPGKGALKDDIHVTDADATKTLDASGSNPAMHQGGAAILQPIGFDAYNNDVTGDVSKTIDTGLNYHHVPNILQSMAVRRLTPVECERLQGFSDNYTNIQSKGKPTPDGPRYKALGNSMAVPVMRWIGERIQKFEEMV